MDRPLIIAPSLLAADRGRMGPEARRAEKGGADWLHVDVMDGHFVPNISFGVDMLPMLRQYTEDIDLDVHLMIDQPNRYARSFIESGADILTVHLEASHDVLETLKMIRNLGCKAGLAINPLTLIDNALPLLPYVDLLLCMTVNPGFGGQKFIPEVLDKVRVAKQFCLDHRLDVEIEVDGGVNLDTAGQAVAAGANVLVAGTALFGEDDMRTAITNLRRTATEISSAG